MASKDLIVVYCPACGQKLKAKQEWLGRRAKCSACAHKFAIEEQDKVTIAKAKAKRAAKADSKETKPTEPKKVKPAAAPDDSSAPPTERPTPPAEEKPPASVPEQPEEDDWDRPTAPPGHRTGERIPLTGPWTELLDWGQRSVVVEFDPDLTALLADEQCDPLWPSDDEYTTFIETIDQPADYLRAQWTVCYLHHPRFAVVMRTLAQIGQDYPLSVSRTLIDLLDHEHEGIRQQAARTLWQKGTLEIAHALRQLKERGSETGPDLLQNTCPEIYADQFEEIFEQNYRQWTADPETVPAGNPDRAD